MEIAISIVGSVFSGLLVSVINKYIIHNKKNQCGTPQTNEDVEVIEKDEEDNQSSDSASLMTAITGFTAQISNYFFNVNC